MAWLSPSYPVGAFSYSSGIEWAVEAGDIKDADSLRRWLAVVIGEGGGFCDAVFFVHAHRSMADTDADTGNLALRAVAELAAAFAPSKERHLETTAQGAAFIEATRAAWPCAALDRLAAAWTGPLAYPVAVGVTAFGHGIALEPALHAFLHAVAANLISAGVRLVPLGQSDGQRVLAALEPIVEATAQRALVDLARRCRQRRVARRSRKPSPRNAIHEAVPLMSKSSHGPLRVGVGGPVGSGKTALMDALCKRLRDRYEIAAITNDIYTKWDAEFLVRSGALAPERIAGVETGGCPHTAIREDASINLAAVADMRKKFPDLDLVLIESGGDNLAATFSPELADLTIYVIDVAAGDKIPSKGGPGITRSDLLVINKVDLAPYVGASLEVMQRDAKKMRGARPFVMTQPAHRRRRRRDRALHRGEGRARRVRPATRAQRLPEKVGFRLARNAGTPSP